VFTPRDRFPESNPDLEAAEALWWERNAEVEEKFCWVQTSRVRTLLRSHYLKRICAAIPPEGRVLEIGCGTGWLSLLLAEAGDFEVHGIDASPEQIERAREAGHGSKAASRVHFHQITPAADALDFLRSVAPFETVIIHGVLHHLSRVEIDRLLRSLRSLAPAGRLVAVEPVWRGDLPPRRFSAALGRLIDRLVLLPRLGERSGWRRTTPEELRLRQQIDSRGDSPKETPFRPGELESLASDHMLLDRTTPVLLFSYLAAKNLLLMQLSHPRLGSLLLMPYLRLVRVIEHLILARVPGPFPLPIFMMYEGRFKDGPAPASL
jgi:2-polyprenyl-3-methyl-5-hydroxy-6-metoxy-1,4-benzoquinol methylase